METKIKTKDQLQSVCEFILWDYDHNVSKIADKNPKVIIQDFDKIFSVAIWWIAEIEVAYNRTSDTITHKPDKPKWVDARFTLLKSESFFQIQKYMNDICEEMSKKSIEYV